MGGGGISQSQKQEQAIAQTQADTGKALATEGSGFLSEGTQLQAPLVSFLQSIIGGNSTTTNQALAPALSTISNNAAAAKEQIYDSTAPGAARDYALAQLPQQTASQVANVTNSTWLQAFPTLAGLAGSQFQTGLGLTGAGITSTGNAGTTTNNVLNSQEQQKASTLGFFGQLAGAAAGGIGSAMHH